MSKYKALKDNLKNVVGEEFEKTLPIIAEEYEAKIRRQAAEITRLLAENERLKPNYENIRAKGQNEAWELARKIVCFEWNGGYTLKELLDIFQADSSPKILNEHTYHEAAAKVAEWERQKKEIKVGDVCMSNTGNCFAIRTIDHEKGNVEILWEDLSSGIVTLDFIKSHCTNTDRRIDIDSISQQIGGKENEGNL